MEDQTHFIQKQKLDFDFPSEEKATTWKKNTHAFYFDEILPLLNNLFNKYIPGDQLYSLDRLEIDLGKIYHREVNEAILKKLDSKLNEIILVNDKSPDLPLEFSKSKSLESKVVGVVVKEQKEKILDVLYTFLDYGILQWNSNIAKIEQLEEALVNQIGIEKLIHLDAFKKRMNLPFIRRRFFYQFSTPFTKQIFYILFSKELETIEFFRSLMTARLDSISIDGAPKKIVRKIISEDSITWIIKADSVDAEDFPKDTIRSVINRIILQLDTYEKNTTPATITTTQSILLKLMLNNEGRSPSPFLNQVIKIMESSEWYDKTIRDGLTSKYTKPEDYPTDKIGKKDNAISSDEESGSKEKEPVPDSSDYSGGDLQSSTRSIEETRTTPIEDIDVVRSDKNSVPPFATQGRKKKNIEQANKEPHIELKSENISLTETEISKKNTRKEEPQALTEYYVLSAGLVLCWPYLNQLFTRTGYLLSTDFKNLKSKERAAHLLGYIASGREKCEEHELIFSKFLTGWPLHIPLAKEIKIFKKEKKEAENMLNNLISNWPVLKNTSIDGLRSAFLKREGKLRQEMDGWRLIVEQKSYDMLLDHVPYSIAIIKLPWSNDILKVDWA
jgi:hypothetical protein